MKKLIAFIFILSGCATQQPRAFDPDLCNKNAAYEAGFNDGRWGYRAMNSEFLNRCREDLREQAQLGYKEGFEKGRQDLKEAQDRKKAEVLVPPANTPNRGGTNININIGGSGGSGGSKAWFCTTKAFMKTFNAYGSTQLEAKQATIASCKTQYHEMHCDDVTCQPNL